MKKLLIISYFFPPANFVGGERTAAWFKYLQEEGFYPIVVTRCWNKDQTELIEMQENDEYTIEIVGNGEIHRIPLKKDFKEVSIGFIRKFNTLIRLLSRRKEIPKNEFNDLYLKSRDLIRKDPEIKIVIASGRPFESFQLGYLLKKEFNITWIPDYRDEWTSHQSPANTGWLWRTIHKQEQKLEKTWTSNADHFLSVTDEWTNRIASYINKPGSTIMNGFDVKNEISTSTQPGHIKEQFVITYAGTMYPSQEIHTFLKAFHEIKKIHNETLQLYFIGTETVPEMNEILKNELDKYSDTVSYINRTNKIELSKIIDKSDLLLLTSFPKVKGWLPVKLFDYFSQNKLILLCPSDDGEIEKFISKTNSGYIVSSVKETTDVLFDLIKNKLEGTPKSIDRNVENAKNYSRQYQTKILANLLHSLSK